MVFFYYYGTVIQRCKCVETSSGDLSQLHAQSPSTTIDHPNLDSMITFPKPVQADTDNSSPYTYNNAPVCSSNSVGLLVPWRVISYLTGCVTNTLAHAILQIPPLYNGYHHTFSSEV